MKRLFGICVPWCICCFIAFGISVAVFGRDSSVTTKAYETLSGWHEAEDYDAIYLESNSIAVSLTSDNIDDTEFRLESCCPYVHCEANISDGTYYINTWIDTSHLFSYYMSVIVDGICSSVSDFPTSLLDSVFSSGGTGGAFDFSLGTLYITVPDRIYESLDVYLGSGSVDISSDISAERYVFDVGSGSLDYSGGGLGAEAMHVTLGSGRISIDGIEPDYYNINIGSGSFEISGLSQGEFDMGSGSGTLSFASLGAENTIDIGSGSLDIYLPSDASARIYTDIGSGNAAHIYGSSRVYLSDGGEYVLGGGDGSFIISMGSGSVNLWCDSFTSTGNDLRTAVTTVTGSSAIDNTNG